MMFPHRNVHTFTWISPDEKTHNQIEHILRDRTWHSSILDVCSGQQTVILAKVRERLAVSEQTTHTVHMERFNLKKLNEVEGNRFADINIAWETITQNIRISAKDAQNYKTKGNEPNCNGYRIQVK
jgi:hypothetical protein